MARRRTVDAALCFDHPRSHVVAVGSRETASGLRRDYRCTPVVGNPHKFSVRVGADARAATARWSPPPPCSAHLDSKVIRYGTYGSKTSRPRQRYRCVPADGTKPHTFTPSLPRDHVHEDAEHCGHCEELRGVHRGETAVARRHTWSTRVVVRGLEQLAAGASYAEVGRWAQRVTGTTRARAKAPVPETDVAKGKRTSPAAKAARNAWHIGADWVEAFSPVIYEPVESRLRSEAYADRERLDEMRSNGEVLERPQVVLVDDVPVYGRDLDQRGKSRRDAGFYVLAAAETLWTPDGPGGRLRLVRAMAKSSTPAWLLLFDELGYDPDFIVADAGTGILAAVSRHFDPSRTKFIPSMWHLNQRIEKALADTRGAHTATPGGRALLRPISDHLRGLRRDGPALADSTAWTAWWDELEALLAVHKLPLDKVRTQRKNNEARMALVLDDLARYPDVPVSTGGLETLIAKHVKPMLAMRRTSFGNLERTNLLFDLAVAAHHGAFDDPADVAALLRADTAATDGWTVALRSIADPRPRRGSYSSLRDTTLLSDIAEARGLL